MTAIGDQSGRRIAIIGAGFSGSLLALHLLRRCRPEDRIYLVERNQNFGRGLAYATGNPNHLLNVRAGNMSAFPDEPDHFVRWLQNLPADQRAEIGDPNVANLGASTFVPRRVYGNYIQELLGDKIWREGQSHNLFLLTDEAVALHRDSDGLSLELAVGRRYPIDHAVLAVGNFPPTASTPGYFGDPWNPACLDGLAPDAPVLILGTGLTFIDTVLSLLDRGHTGKIYALSRRGLLPRVHAAVPAPWKYEAPPSGRNLVKLLRQVRTIARIAEKTGAGRRAAIDGLRPHTQRLWQEMSLPERARFLRHLRPWWDVHRHRAAPQVMARIEAAIAAGQIEIIKGRIGETTRLDETSVVHVNLRGDSGRRELVVDRVIDCSGPRSDATRLDQKLIQQLLASGQVRPDPLRLGLDVDPAGNVIDRQGHVTPDLHAIGPITKGTFWEIIAVPDLRIACAALAERLL
ncbi:FAD/NAD(P)-binding protein [Dongia rigui]|uniref:FAD/NAD(P)-binding protein n=1 Tax=Dongia rigui TaxID=940149 RepID=A0ABU5E1Q5_9PROT|nr:FAD/NAD(P)-binding protein [Dongia rigui]MDY0873418.1 FAD/NAD(P)-binding protein [Dongia rigui]